MEDMEIVRKPDEDDSVLDNLYQTKIFVCKVDGVWDFKKSNATCEYFHITSCNRMTFRKELDHEYEELRDRENMANDDKRKIMYRNYIYDKYEGLRRDIRTRMPICVVRYIKQIFPITDADGMFCNRI